jgi:hypothetical protein
MNVKFINLTLIFTLQTAASFGQRNTDIGLYYLYSAFFTFHILNQQKVHQRVYVHMLKQRVNIKCNLEFQHFKPYSFYNGNEGK